MDSETELENGGMLSQADLDALIAAAGQTETGGMGADGIEADGMETDGGAFFENAEEEADAAPPPRAAASPLGLIDLPSFAPAAPLPAAADGATGLSRVRDIPLEVTVELGRTRLLIRDILDLSAGSIIELDKVAGEPVDLFANGMLVARGEVIVIDDNFGVRVTEIITAGERGSSEKDAHARAA